jgi:hypothetical protein
LFYKTLIGVSRTYPAFLRKLQIFLHPEFNISPTAGSQLGMKHSKETKQKLKDVWKNRGPVSEETKQKMRKPKSEETKQKMKQRWQNKKASFFT